MITISINYDLKYIYRFDEKYQFTEDYKCFNILTGKEVKRTLIGYSEGFCLNSKFKTLKFVKENVKDKNEDYCPF